MDCFYFDNKLSVYESFFQWDDALNYLEELYSHNKDITVLCSLVGYSWYYLVEGPITSKLFENDPNVMALKIWKKYIDVGVREAYNNSFFNFIAGYTLSLHGFFISGEYERKGKEFLERCLALSDDLMVRRLAENFLENEKSKQYIPLKDAKIICRHFFCGNSLLSQYFMDIYNS